MYLKEEKKYSEKLCVKNKSFKRSAMVTVHKIYIFFSQNSAQIDFFFFEIGIPFIRYSV